MRYWLIDVRDAGVLAEVDRAFARERAGEEVAAALLAALLDPMSYVDRRQDSEHRED